MAHTLQKKQAIDTVPEEILTLNLLGKDFKLAIINMFQVKKIMPQQLKDNVSPNREYQIDRTF